MIQMRTTLAPRGSSPRVGAHHTCSSLAPRCRYGDVNCQKAVGAATSLLGLVTGLASLLNYAAACWRTLPDEAVILGVTFTTQWRWGAGFALMFVATLGKV